MTRSLSRREALKLAGLSAGALALRPLPPDSGYTSVGLARVATTWIGLYKEPSFRSPQLARLSRDEIVTLLTREISDEGPSYNPLWYRLSDGYAHSGHLQVVRWEPQAPQLDLPEGGALFEVSIPYTRSYRHADASSDPLYRLYYQSTAWAEAAVEGADGKIWYRLVDELLHVRYFVHAEHLRHIPPEELTPISPHIPLNHKRIEVSLAHQELRAYEEGKLVLQTTISSGIMDSTPRDNGIPTMTPRGRFYVDKKMPLRHMGDGHLTPDIEAYELPGVPWVLFFHITGVALHGTYWHTNFGVPMSHGCVNMRTEEAKWLYRWTLPSFEPNKILNIGHGTSVIVE